MVPSLPPTPWALASRRDDEICDVLERYAYYHPEIRQNLQILPSQYKTQPKVWTPTTKAGHITPWKVLCVDLIGPYTLKGQDGSSIDFMCLTMINPATSWFEIVELPTVDLVMTVPPMGKGKKVTSSKNTMVAETTFDNKSSAQISNVVYKTWFSRYPRCRYIIYNNGSKFNLHFRSLWDTYGIKRKSTSVKNQQANAILELLHTVFGNMLRTSKLDMSEMVKASDIDAFLSDAAWAVCSTYHPRCSNIWTRYAI